MRKYYLKLIWFLWYKNEVQVLAQGFLKTPTLHVVTAEVIELNKRKISKRHRVFPARGQSLNNNSRKRKSFKKLHRFKHELKFLFLFSTLNRGGWNVGEKQWGKHSYLATSRADIREAHTILAHRFTDSLFSLHVYVSFLSILAHFPKSKL